MPEPAPPAAPPPMERRHAWRRLARISRLRLTRGNAMAALVTLLLGLALVAQVRSTQAGDLESLRESDLVGLLDDVSERAERLRDEVRTLEQDKSRLEGSQGDAAAEEAARSRLRDYQIFAGTVPVTGEGVALVVTDPRGDVSTTVMIDLVQELRDAGAEAIQIGSVRVVASTWVQVRQDELRVDGRRVDAPYRITAIGDSHTLSGALAIPGGFIDKVRRVDGEVLVTEGRQQRIDAVRDPATLEFARPVESTPGR
ncbi:MAG: DUF881 domain-containing protein [Ornithinimicrobium sp.]|uniref:DUF881 domain-containing protein n=1 Tax=Ornithinimicrobium sp. TaxID=1977084 RepID=UPI003D9AD6D0